MNKKPKFSLRLLESFIRRTLRRLLVFRIVLINSTAARLSSENCPLRIIRFKQNGKNSQDSILYTKKSIGKK